MKSLYFAVFVLFLLTLGIGTVHATVYNITPAEDSYISSANPNTNFGIDESLIAGGGTGGWSGEYRILLRFNTSGYLLNGLTNATLTLTANNNTSVFNIAALQRIKNVTGSWNESGVTWNLQPTIDQTIASRNVFLLTGETVTFTSFELFNFVSTNVGGIIDLEVTDPTGGYYTTFYGSSEANPNFYPKLQLTYNGTGYQPNTTFSAVINSVFIPAVVNLNDTRSTTVTFTNTGNTTATYMVGFSIGNTTTGFCNTDCYVGGNNGLANDGTRWYAVNVAVAPDHTAVVSTPFHFRDDFFESRKFYEARVTIRPMNSLTILANLTIPNAVAVYPINTFAPAGAIGKILNISINDPRPTPTQIITARIRVTNNGTESGNFYVGFSIGKNTTGFCNRNCYNDCNGTVGTDCDYAQTGVIHVGQTVTVSRQFYIDPFFFYTGNSYDVNAAVYNAPYLSPSQALDYVTLPDFINMTTFAMKLNTYAIDGRSDPFTVQVQNVTALAEDVTTISASIFNNASIGLNYTIGISIGKWSASDGVVYRETQPSLMPSCDIGCFVGSDDRFIFAFIPENVTIPVSRQFRIPHFFPQNNTYDAAVAVYAGTLEGDRQLVTVVYFKDVGRVILPQDFRKLPDVTTPIARGIGQLFGVDLALGKVLIAVIVTLIFTGLIAVKTKDGLITTVVLETLLIMFTALTWFPWPFFIVEAVIAAFLVARFVGKSFSGGQ